MTKLQDQLGFALKHDERHGWLVIEEGEDDRCATITEQVLWQALTGPGYLAAPVAPAEQSHAASYMEGISDGRAEAAQRLVPLSDEQRTAALLVPSNEHPMSAVCARCGERWGVHSHALCRDDRGVSVLGIKP